MKAKQITVAIYARVSTRDKQETLNQLAQLREFCKRQGWQVFTEYIDHESGSVSAREAFQKMFLQPLVPSLRTTCIHYRWPIRQRNFSRSMTRSFPATTRWCSLEARRTCNSRNSTTGYCRCL
ncbi:MAG: recombinase family protein [Terriglobales bacterium]